MTGTEVSKIFEPVVQEIVTLVKGQIASTGKKVRAVLMVGGFGQNAYLRDTIRASIDRKIEVMQPPNGWTAVVRGALMKGLAQVKPATVRVKVEYRTARKHYGADMGKKYDETKHVRSKAYWSGYYGELRVRAMSWYINKGNPVTEDKAFIQHFTLVRKVSQGPSRTKNVSLLMCSDPDDVGAPIYRDNQVKELAQLTADLSCIPAGDITRKFGKDGIEYYVMDFQIEMTYFSAHTEYVLVYNKVRYGSVMAEYV
jgi:hypothetical protein